MRIHVMPAVRMLWIVAMKLIAPASDAIVSRCSERIHRSTPCPGEYCGLGERRVARPAALRRAAAGEEAEKSVRPPKRKNQYDIAFSRGNATSRAPIIKRHEVVAEAGEDRHDDEEDHHRPVEREQLVVAGRA
jgi:hypothetical protein